MKEDKKNELSSTGAIAPVTVPVGKIPNYSGKEKEKEEEPEVWDDQTIVEIKENILKNIKKIK